MFVEFQRDATVHRVFRGLRLVSGRRRQWITGRTLGYVSIAIYRRQGAHAAYLFGTAFFYELPHWPAVWLWLFERWNDERSQPRRV